ncbi:hypothetical protein GGS21DRAFT_167000 [Xylaria nigripes]|nr:hypothetical protein GGS21DRAFT_167000 [Xylaria nigripes]
MPESSPKQRPSLAFGSLPDHGDPTNEFDSVSRRSKKKKRTKKQQNSTSQPDEDISHLTADVDLPDGLEQQQDGLTGEDTHMNLDSTPTGTQEQTQAHIPSKKERKRNKRAAKLAKQQASVVSAVEADEEPSHVAEVADAEESTFVVKPEKEDKDRQPTKNLDTEPKKKRKRKSRNRVEDEPQQSPKKFKHSHSEGRNEVVSENQDGEAHHDTVENIEASRHGDLDENGSSQQLHIDHEQSLHPDVNLKDSTMRSKARPKDEGAVDAMDEDVQVGREANDEVELHQDDDDNGEATMASEAQSASHIGKRHRASAPSQSATRLAAATTHKDVLVTTGITQDEVGDHEEQGVAGVDKGVPSTPMNGAAVEEIEVPSTLPNSNSKDEPRLTQPASSKTRSGRKRVAKPDFFSRMADDTQEIANSQSPSKATSASKKNQGKQVAVLDEGAQARSPVTIRRSTRSKNTTVAKESSKSDSDAEELPSAEKVETPRTPKTPVTVFGSLSDLEIRNLTQTIELFREENDMTQFQVNDLIHCNPKDPKAIDLWGRITASVPGRSRQGVIYQTRRRFHNFAARGAWTPEQDQELAQLFERYGNKYTLIGKYMNRYVEDVRDRVRNYIICGKQLKKDYWSDEETDRLIAIVEKAITEIEQQRAKRGDKDNRPVDEDINWQLVSQGMNRTRSRLQCLSKWKAIKPQLAGGGLDGVITSIEEVIEQARRTAVAITHRNRCLIIKEILKTGAKNENLIPWVKVRAEFEYKWTRPPLLVIWYRLKRTVPNWKSLNVQETYTDDIDYDAEYREIAFKIKRHQKSKSKAKRVADSKFSDEDDEDDEDDDNDDVRNEGEQEDESEKESKDDDKLADEQLDTTDGSVDLGLEGAGAKYEIEDSEPEANTRKLRYGRTRSGGRPPKPQVLPMEEYDESSDTNASQVASIPAS